MDNIHGEQPILSASQLDAAALCKLIRASLDDDKAEEIVVVEISEKCSFADYMVVATGRSQRHVGALADKLQDRLKEVGSAPLSIEGKESCEWVLIDAGDVIVHLFKPEIRELYNLEKMWSIPAPVGAESRLREVQA